MNPNLPPTQGSFARGGGGTVLEVAVALAQVRHEQLLHEGLATYYDLEKIKREGTENYNMLQHIIDDAMT